MNMRLVVLLLVASLSGCAGDAGDEIEVTLVSRLRDTDGGPHTLAEGGYMSVELLPGPDQDRTDAHAWDPGCVLLGSERDGPSFDCRSWIPREVYRAPHSFADHGERVETWYPLDDGVLRISLPYPNGYTFIIQGPAADPFAMPSCQGVPPKYVDSGAPYVIDGDAEVQGGGIFIRGDASIVVEFGIGC